MGSINIPARLRRRNRSIIHVQRIRNASTPTPRREVERAALRKFVDADVQIRQRSSRNDYLRGAGSLEEISCSNADIVAAPFGVMSIAVSSSMPMPRG